MPLSYTLPAKLKTLYIRKFSLKTLVLQWLIQKQAEGSVNGEPTTTCLFDGRNN